MNLSIEIIEELLASENKALATTGKHGINVVPVSTMRIVDNKIILMNYFLNKTLENLLEETTVALSCWKGLKGYQIKGTTTYTSEGADFDAMKLWVETNIPNRTLKGFISITPEHLYDVSPQ